MRTWLFVLASFVAAGGSAQEIFVRSSTPVDESHHPVLPWVQKYETFRIDSAQLTQFLASTPLQNNAFTQFRVISLPTPDGTIVRFKIAESPIMSPAVQATTPVRTYKLVGIDDKYASGRVDWGPNGFSGLIMSPMGSYIIDPPKIGDRTQMIAYYRRDSYKPKAGFMCLTQDNGPVNRLSGLGLRAQSGDTLKTYRLAMNADGEYTQFYGGQTAAENGIVTSVNRINQIYEVDISAHLNLIYKKAWTDPNTDPYTNNSGGAMLGENQTETDASVGDANYDMGHVFSTGGGGIASLNSVGITGRKAQGVTGLPAPQGDDFDIDFVAHEMGHQFGGHHPFNGNDGNCGGAKDSPHAYEPGSGTTIMAYAGICGTDDIQPHSDPYFHVDSLDTMNAWRDNSQSGGTEATNGNTKPVVDAGPDATVPQNTPFRAKATGSDANGDPITYCWEQFDLGNSSNGPPIYRSVTPTASPMRFFPKLTTVLTGGTDRWEPMITADRKVVLRVTARDNRPGGGGIATDDMTVTVTGPQFKITAPTGNVTWPGGSTQTITWTVGGGSVSPNVRILYSADGGASYAAGTATVLLASTPNDGTQAVTIPQIQTTTGHIIVEAVESIFYDISIGNITTNPTQVPILTDFTLQNTTVVGGQGTNGVLTVDFAGGGAQTVTLSSNNPNAVVPSTATIPANSLQGTFPINTLGVVTDQFATISATLGNVTKTRQLEITRDVGPVQITVNPNPVGGGARALGTVFLSRPAPLGGVVVKMTDNGPELAVNPNVIVASTFQQQNFTIVTYAVNASVTRTITGTRAGLTATVNVTIVPFKLANFTVAPSGVVGGNTATGSVYLNAPAPQGGVTVNISDNSALITTPASVTILEGASSAVFPIGTGTTGTAVTKQIVASMGNQQLTRNLGILPAELASVTSNPTTIKGGQNAVGTVFANGNAASGFVVNLSSNAPELIVPASVTFAFGTSSKTFTIKTLPVNNGRTRVITATRNGRTRTVSVVITK